MSMTSVLHRRTSANVVDAGSPPAPGRLQPTVGPGGPGPDHWPTGAKVIVALLIAATVLGLIGSAVGLASGSDGSTERELRDRITGLTQERDRAVGDIAGLDAELANLRTQLQDAQAEIDASGDRNGVLGDRVIELEGRIATLTDTRDSALSQALELEARVTALTEERDVAVSSAEQSKAALATVQQRLAAVTAERDSLARLFPVRFDTPLANVITPGKYGVKASELYCVGLASCGSTPAIGRSTISRTNEGFLRLSIPNLVDGGLYRAAGALHLATESTSAVPACAGVARTATVAATIFPQSYTLDAKGAPTLAGLSAVITVEAPATDACPAVLAFYSATLGQA